MPKTGTTDQANQINQAPRWALANKPKIKQVDDPFIMVNFDGDPTAESEQYNKLERSIREECESRGFKHLREIEIQSLLSVQLLFSEWTQSCHQFHPAMFVYPHRRMHSAAALQPYIRLHIFPAASKGQLQGEFLNKAWFLVMENASSAEIQWDLSTPSWGL